MTTPNQPPNAATVGPEAKDAAEIIEAQSKRLAEIAVYMDAGTLAEIIQRAITSATANLRRELEAATKERDDALKELRPVEKYVQTLTNRVPIDVVLQVVRTCAILGHEKYPKSCL